jgi:hypothetical protein
MPHTFGRFTSLRSVQRFTEQRDPTLDPDEHDAFAWCLHRDAAEMLDWPVEKDALDGRRSALRELASLLGAN